MAAVDTVVRPQSQAFRRFSASALPVLTKLRGIRSHVTGMLASHYLTIAGFGLIDAGVFHLGTAAGFIATGISCLALEWKADDE
jgi:hypothetical protein